MLGAKTFPLHLLTPGFVSVSPLKIGTYPTPIERVDGNLWIKRDDLVSPIYGGNKVRKLERLLADAEAQGKRRIVTIGAAGSHHVLATTVFGTKAGFEVEAVLVPQQGTDHARANLRAALALGVKPIIAASWDVAPALLRGDGYRVPLGGSSVVGSLGYVDAAHELREQVRAGVMPEPDAIVVALGSGGTAAGLAVGLAGLKTRVIGIAVSSPLRLVEAMARRLVRKLVQETKLSSELVPNLEVDRRWLGRGYGYATREGDHATARASRFGIPVDVTYTAKAFAAAQAIAAEAPEQTILFWHTLSSAPVMPDLPPLPAEYERLFK